MAVLAVFGQTDNCFSELLLIFYSYIVEVIFINGNFSIVLVKIINHYFSIISSIVYIYLKVQAVPYSCTFTVLAFEKKICYRQESSVHKNFEFRASRNQFFFVFFCLRIFH